MNINKHFVELGLRFLLWLALWIAISLASWPCHQPNIDVQVPLFILLTFASVV